MKVITVFGTRPEIIRLSLVMRLLDQHCDHLTIHTGQNYTESLSDVFLRELEVRTPNYHLGLRSSNFGEQIGAMLARVDEILAAEKPDRMVLLGDTNSALTAILAARRNIPVFHLEAGNRCYDNRVPEEVNRRIIDHASAFLLPYTERSKDNLVREGIERERIFVTGNPIFEVLLANASKIDESKILETLGVKAYEFFLVTLHRAENVDSPSRLKQFFDGLQKVGDRFGKPMLISLHPRTASKLAEFEIEVDQSKIRLLEPLGFFDFVKLEKNAQAVLTDSGTVQEECAIFKIPNVTLRDVTERPETIEAGSNILSGADADAILRAVEIAVSHPAEWTPPAEYLSANVARTVLKIVLGHHSLRRHVS